jgi:predicted protein tyrosine phosphatase
MKTRLLFVCSANRQRSPTAEQLFENSERYEARSCGTHAMLGNRCDSSLMEWADIIFCMEEHHRQALLAQHPEAEDKMIVVLDIPDMYLPNDPHLIMQLREKLGEYLEKTE